MSKISPYIRNIFDGVITDKSNQADTEKFYAKWAEKYDEDIVLADFGGQQQIVDAFFDLRLDKDVKILDILAGTGAVAKLLLEKGYTNIDAQDGCQKMLDVAKKQNLYNKYIRSYLGKGHTLPVSQGEYDVLILVGALAPGHLYPDVFPELIRITKKGGLIMWVVREGYEAISPEFATFEDEVEKFIKQGAWKFEQEVKKMTRYFLGFDGTLYIMRKL